MPLKVLIDGAWLTASVAAGVAPSVPLSVAASSTVAGRIDVSWSTPASAGSSPITGYSVVFTPVSGSGIIAVAAANQRALSKTGLVEGASYTVTVATLNAAGTSSPSAPIAVSVARTAATGNNQLVNPSSFGMPDATNTGPTSSVSALRATGSITTTADGQIIEGVNVTGNITVLHADVTIRNFQVVYSSSSTSGRAIDATGASGTLTIQDGTVTCTQGCNAAIYVEHATVVMERLNVSGGQDCIDIATQSQDVTISDCFVHNPIRATGSHDDCIQVFSCGDLLIEHNTLIAYTGAAIGSYPGAGDPMNSSFFIGMLSAAGIGSITFQENLCDGGNYTIGTNSTGVGSSVSCGPLKFLDNRFGTDYRYGVKAGLGSPFVTTWSGNVDDATGATV